MVLRRRDARLIGCALAVSFVLALSSCEQSPTRRVSVLDDDAVTVASFNFPESVLLGEIYSQALEDRGIAVDRQLNLGPRELVLPALHQGLVELVPEYSGSAVEFVGLGEIHASSEPAATRERLEAVLQGWDVRVLQSAPAQDSNGLVVSEDLAAERGLATISDLVPIAGELRLGGPPECPTRPLCIPGLQRVYGLMFDEFTPLDTSGPLTVEGLRTGHVQVAVLFTTDGQIESQGFVLLEDDRGLQPAENVTPIIRDEVLRVHGTAIEQILDEVSARLTTAALRRLNAGVASGRETIRVVAADWLRTVGLVHSG